MATCSLLDVQPPNEGGLILNFKTVAEQRQNTFNINHEVKVLNLLLFFHSLAQVSRGGATSLIFPNKKDA